MENSTVDIFKDIFESDLFLLKNKICVKCDAKIKKPLMPWIVGSQYFDTHEKILFVGKPHRGTPGEELPSGILDPREPHLDWLMDCSWPYWSYTKEILSQKYLDENPWKYCAFTNIIKCTNVEGEGNPTNDASTYKMAESCVQKLGVIHKEITTLKPLNISAVSQIFP